MIDDYKNNTYEHSENYDNPYFNYYMYLPTHSKTGYSAAEFDQIISNAGYTSNVESGVTYVIETADGHFSSWAVLAEGRIPRSQISLMYNQGVNFIESQETYGVNALLTFSAAINESATGTSAISFGKYNIFGHGAVDSAPYFTAIRYFSIREAIFGHAIIYST